MTDNLDRFLISLIIVIAVFAAFLLLFSPKARLGYQGVNLYQTASVYRDDFSYPNYYPNTSYDSVKAYSSPSSGSNYSTTYTKYNYYPPTNYIYTTTTTTSPNYYYNCPNDALVCPTGGAVRRVGPNCTFPACPSYY